jgi:hypothetical protein
MPYRVLRFEPTPNPNALKCVVDPSPLASDPASPLASPRSYFRVEQAAGDALAECLFAIEGVSTLLIHAAFITVNKRPDAPWPPIRRAVERALADAH